MFNVGHIIRVKMPFKDGTESQSPRPYLIIRADRETVDVLNISSISGKEHKLLFPTNIAIQQYNPPLGSPSFVKLDSMQTVKISDLRSWGVMPYGNGLPLNHNDTNRILSMLINIKR